VLEQAGGLFLVAAESVLRPGQDDIESPVKRIAASATGNQGGEVLRP